MTSKEFEMLFWIFAFSTALTFHQRVRAVQFHEKIAACARKAVQPVDVLRDHAAKLPGALQADNGVMHRIRFCIAKGISSFELVIPMLDPRRFRRHEILEVHWLPRFPDPLWSAKIGDAAAGGNTGASKDERFL